MRSIDYARASRAMFCSVLLLSQHTVVDANAWVTGRSSRSSTLAVAAPGGRDRPIRDWKAMNRDAGKALEERKEKAAEKAEEVVVEAVEQVLPEVDGNAEDVADSLDLEQGTPQSLAVVLGKVAVIATVGVIGAKKVVRFAKALIKARKDRSLGSVEDVSAIAATQGSGDEEEQEDEAADEVVAEKVGVVVDDDDDEEGNDEVTDVFVTPEEDEEESENQDPSQRGDALSKATEDAQARAESELEYLTKPAGDEEGESDEGTGTGDGDSDVKYSGKGDVSYV